MSILDRLLEVFGINRTMGSQTSESLELLEYVKAVRARAFQKITGKKLHTMDSLDASNKLKESSKLSLLRRLRR